MTFIYAILLFHLATTGIDGADGQPGRDGKDGQPGRDGLDGKQGPLPSG